MSKIVAYYVVPCQYNNMHYPTLTGKYFDNFPDHASVRKVEVDKEKENVYSLRQYILNTKLVTI